MTRQPESAEMESKSLQERAEEFRRLRAEATKGEWIDDSRISRLWASEWGYLGEIWGGSHEHGNISFIVHAANHAPQLIVDLLQEIERQATTIQQLEEALGDDALIGMQKISELKARIDELEGSYERAVDAKKLADAILEIAEVKAGQSQVQLLRDLDKGHIERLELQVKNAQEAAAKFVIAMRHYMITAESAEDLCNQFDQLRQDGDIKAQRILDLEAKMREATSPSD